MHRNNLLIFVLTIVLALGGCVTATAQTTVNAPDALMKRGGEGGSKATEAPAAESPSSSEGSESKESTKKSKKGGTKSRNNNGGAASNSQPERKYVPTGASFWPDAATIAATQAAAEAARKSAAENKGKGGKTAATKNPNQITGFRVQVLFSSDTKARTLARSRAREVALKFPSYRCYLSYVAPQWRLRFGDFKRREDANLVMKRFCAQFPQFKKDIIVVQDKVNVR